MIREQIVLNVIDSFGARRVVCIRVLGGLYCRHAGAGGVIKIIIKETTPRGKIRKGDVLKTVVARIRKGVRRPDGSVIRFGSSACVLLNNNSEQPVGTHILRPVTRKFRSEKLMKVISLAPEVL